MDLSFLVMFLAHDDYRRLVLVVVRRGQRRTRTYVRVAGSFYSFKRAQTPRSSSLVGVARVSREGSSSFVVLTVARRIARGQTFMRLAMAMSTSAMVPCFELRYFPLLAKGLGPALVAEHSGLPWAGSASLDFSIERDWPRPPSAMRIFHIFNYGPTHTKHFQSM